MDKIPPNFRVVLSEITTYKGQRKGGIAQVVNPGHIFHLRYVSFGCRHYGEYNLTDKSGVFTLTIMPQYPPKLKGDEVVNLCAIEGNVCGFADRIYCLDSSHHYSRVPPGVKNMTP